jgi:hypothetical protein
VRAEAVMGVLFIIVGGDVQAAWNCAAP